MTASLVAAAARAEAGLALAQANLAKYQNDLPQQIAATEAQIKTANAQIAAGTAQRDRSVELTQAEAAQSCRQARKRSKERGISTVGCLIGKISGTCFQITNLTKSF